MNGRGAKPLMVIHPDAATEAVKQVLRRGGYTVVVSDEPDLFRVVGPDVFVTNDVAFLSAMHAIRHTPHDDVRVRFALQIAVRILGRL